MGPWVLINARWYKMYPVGCIVTEARVWAREDQFPLRPCSIVPLHDPPDNFIATSKADGQLGPCAYPILGADLEPLDLVEAVAPRATKPMGAPCGRSNVDIFCS